MSLVCPSCAGRVPKPAAARPGRFRVACPGCGKPFAVTVPSDPRAAWVAGPIAGRADRAARRSDVGSAVVNAPSVAVAAPGGRTPMPSHKALAPAGSVPDGDSPPAEPPRAIPGYVLEGTLGHGGMGTVYLGRQLSLDRPVALKVMSRKWAADAVFVARFTREAYAAALLNHPNVVQIFDIGEADGVRFFSMEYVPGKSLADHLKLDGKLDCETAVGFVLQAARGLKHAHDRGMIHRDVKPDNLLLNDQGVVKVADLGLVKTPDTPAAADRLDGSKAGLSALPADMTGTRMALGTPAYMAPEQCRDASKVDHRADIYSLGCTLYVLVTGRPPFDAGTAVELMTKHAYEPIVPPEAIVGRVPKELSAVILKMLAKDRADRFASMAEVIRTLELWLGVHHAGTFSPRDEQIDQLEAVVRDFHAAPAAVLKARVVTGAVSAVSLAAVLLTFFGQLGWAFGLAGFVLQAAGVYFVLNGVANRTYLFRRVRQFAFGLTAWDGAIAAAGLGLFAVLLWLLGLFWVWAGFGVLGAAAAFALKVGFDRAIDRERAGALAGCERLLRKMRGLGQDEEDLRQFVAKYAGRHWEEFFEALFGFEAKLQARALLLRGGSAGVREKFAGWREPVVNLIDRVEKARREAAERTMLEHVEQARLEAAGVTAGAARVQAEVCAAALVRQADAIRHADTRRRKALTVGNGQPGTPGSVPNLGQLLAQAVAAPPGPPPGRDWFGSLANLFVGPHVRSVSAGVLLAACGLWVHQNKVFAGLTPSADAAGLQSQAERLGRHATTPLAVAGLPPGWTAWADSANTGWAGALLLASLFARGNRMGALVLLGAGVCVLGPRLGIRTVEPVRDTHVALMLGSVFSLVGYRLGGRR